MPSDLASFVNNSNLDATDAVQTWLDAGEPIIQRGALYIKNPPLIYTRDHSCAGEADQVRADGAWDNFAERTVTVLVHHGTDLNQSLVEIYYPSIKIANTTYQGKRMLTADSVEGTTTLIETYDPGASNNTGEITFEDCTFLSAGKGIYTAPSSHSDWFHLSRCLFHKVNWCIDLNENQSVGHHFEFKVKGDCDRIFSARDGGRFTAEIVTNGAIDRVLVLGDEDQDTFPSKNNGYFKIHHIMDGGDSVGSFVEERHLYAFSKPVVIYTGFMADDAVIDQDPILLNDADVSIRMRRCLLNDYMYKSSRAITKDNAWRDYE